MRERAFLRAVIEHDRAGVDMAKLALRRGEHPTVGTFALTIIGSRSAEIRHMTALLRRLPPAPGAPVIDEPAPPAYPALGLNPAALGFPPGGNGLTAPPLDTADPFDRAFIDLYVPYLKGSLAIAKTGLAKPPRSAGGAPSSRRRRSPVAAAIRQFASEAIPRRICEIRRLDMLRERQFGLPGGDSTAGLTGRGTGVRRVRCPS